MNFDFSEEQLSLKDEARKFLASLSPLQGARAVLDEPERMYDVKAWAGIVAQGWTGAVIPEEYGGLELSYFELCVLNEELGYCLAAVPFSSTIYLFAELLMLAGSDRQKRALLPQIARGSVVGTVAFAEDDGRTGWANPKARVSHAKLNGVKRPVVDAGIAHHCVVLASSDAGPSLFLVNMSSDGVVTEPLETIDPTRDCGSLTFRDAEAEPLGEAGQGVAILQRLFDRAAVLFAFEQIGAADRCLELSRSYAMERYAFGRKIGSYQAIKHKLADMFVKNQLARSNAYFGAWALNGNETELPAAAAAARISACDALWFASCEMIQTHGGIGYTWESDCHLFFRRGKQLALSIGAPAIWKERLAGLLEQSNIGVAA